MRRKHPNSVTAIGESLAKPLTLEAVPATVMRRIVVRDYEQFHWSQPTQTANLPEPRSLYGDWYRRLRIRNVSLHRPIPIPDVICRDTRSPCSALGSANPSGPRTGTVHLPQDLP